MICVIWINVHFKYQTYNISTQQIRNQQIHIYIKDEFIIPTRITRNTMPIIALNVFLCQKLPLSNHATFFPMVMHTIQKHKHPWKTLVIDIHSLSKFVFVSNQMYYCFSKASFTTFTNYSSSTLQHYFLNKSTLSIANSTPTPCVKQL